MEATALKLKARGALKIKLGSLRSYAPRKEQVQETMSNFPTSTTIPSSIVLRFRVLAQRMHDLRPRAFHEAMCAVAGGADPVSAFEHFGAYSLHADPNPYGNGALPRLLRRIK